MSIQSVILSSQAEEDIAMAKVWLITGSGNGLGRNIAEAALAAGDSVVAGARRTEELAPLVAQYGERMKPVTLEVREEAAAKAAVQIAVDAFGQLDVLVNKCRLWAVCAIRADECGRLPSGRGQMLLRRGVHNARRRASNAQAEKRSHLSGVFDRWSPGVCRQYAVSRGQVGCGWFQRRSGDGSRAVRGQDLHIGAGRYSNQLGTARGAECARPAAGLRGLGRFDAQDVAKPRRAFGRGSAEDRRRNCAIGE